MCFYVINHNSREICVIEKRQKMRIMIFMILKIMHIYQISLSPICLLFTLKTKNINRSISQLHCIHSLFTHRGTIIVVEIICKCLQMFILLLPHLLSQIVFYKLKKIEYMSLEIYLNHLMWRLWISKSKILIGTLRYESYTFWFHF